MQIAKFEYVLLLVCWFSIYFSLADGLLLTYFLQYQQFKPDPRFEEAKQLIRSGTFGSYDYAPLLDSLEGNSGFGRGDYFLVGYDFPSYIDAQIRVDEAYK